MMRITISVKDSKLQQLLEYLKTLDYVNIEESPVLGDGHKKVLDEELNHLKKNPKNLIPLQEFKKNVERFR